MDIPATIFSLHGGISTELLLATRYHPNRRSHKLFFVAASALLLATGYLPNHHSQPASALYTSTVPDRHLIGQCRMREDPSKRPRIKSTKLTHLSMRLNNRQYCVSPRRCLHDNNFVNELARYDVYDSSKDEDIPTNVS